MSSSLLSILWMSAGRAPLIAAAAAVDTSDEALLHCSATLCRREHVRHRKHRIRPVEQIMGGKKKSVAFKARLGGRSRRVSTRPLLAAGASLMAAATTCDAFGFGVPASRLVHSRLVHTRCTSRCLGRRTHRLRSAEADDEEVSEAYSALEERLEAEIQELEEEIGQTVQSSTEDLGEANDDASASISEEPTEGTEGIEATEELEVGEPRLSKLAKLKELFWLCRPSNFPVVTLFHALGVFLSARCWTANSDCAPAVAATAVFSPLMRHPAILTTLVSLILVTSTSMVTNDYYDARNGVDAPSPNEEEGEGQYEHYHPLANGDLPYSLAKTFDSWLYAALLFSSAAVPGIIPRTMVIGAAIITYLYTTVLKPRTWIKNLSCAALVAMSPVTSGLAAWHVLTDGPFVLKLGIETATRLPFHLIFKSRLSWLVVSLFFGIMSREILMDITDCEGDRNADICTLPVKYGSKYASSVALGCSAMSALAACGASRSILNFVDFAELFMNPPVRRGLLSFIGSWGLLYRTARVYSTRGEDVGLAERAVREGTFWVVLILASFV